MESIMMPIAQVSWKTNDTMEWPKRSSSSKIDTHMLHNGQQVADHGALQVSGIRASSSPKTSHQGFLNWVAYTRNLAAGIHEIDRRTCPLIDCEQLFDHPDAMLLHLKICPRISKGLYRCIDSGKEERIGKCASSGCLQLQHCKDRIATAMSSLKRRLSPRGSRPRRFAETRNEKQTISPEMSVVDQTWDGSYPVGIAELSHDVRFALPELASSSSSNMAAELDTQNAYFYHSTNFAHAQDTLAELEPGTYTTQIAVACFSPLYHAPKSDFIKGLSNFTECHSAAGCDIPELDGRDLIYKPLIATEEAYVSAETNVGGIASHDLPAYHEDAFTQATSLADRQITANYWCTLNPNKPSQRPMPGEYKLDEFMERVVVPKAFEGHPSLDHAHCFKEMDQSSSITWDSANPQGFKANSMGSCSTVESIESKYLFTDVPSWESSVSSLGSLESMICSQTSTESSNDDPVRFFEEPWMMCDEPESIDPFPLSPEPYGDAGFSIFDNIQQNISTIGKRNQMVAHDLPLPYNHIQPSKQLQIPRKPVADHQSPVSEPMSANFARAPSLIPDIDYSLQHQTQPEYVCNFCSRSFKDKSNRNRHQTTCRQNSGNHRSDKPYRCTYPRCAKSYTRSDNLLVHQKKKQHEIKECFQLQASNLSQNLLHMLYDGSK